MSTKILKYPKWRTKVNNVSQPEPNYANVNQNMQCELEYANVNQNMQVRVYIMSYRILLNIKNVSPFGNTKKKQGGHQILRIKVEEEEVETLNVDRPSTRHVEQWWKSLDDQCMQWYAWIGIWTQPGTSPSHPWSSRTNDH